MAIKKIRLTAANMLKYGFARFLPAGEGIIAKDVWLRTIEAGNSEELEIEVASEFIMQLSNDVKQRITSKEDFAILSGEQTIDSMYFLSQRAGWNQTISDIETFVHLNPAASFLATVMAGDSPAALGSGMVLQAAESLAWIGMILVHKELRRQGIAKALMKHCIAFAGRDLGMPCIGLDATPMGMPLYSSLGFKESFSIWRSTLSANASLKKTAHCKVQGMTSTDSVTGYLKKRSLAEKKALLEILFNIQKKGCFTAQSGDEITGVVWSRPGRLKPFIGPLVADSAEIACSLLQRTLRYWHENGHDAVFLDIPERHFEQKSRRDDINKSLLPPQGCLLYKDIRPVRQFSRMYLLGDANETDHSKTVLYMALEKNNIKPYLYSTGGPEIS